MLISAETRRVRPVGNNPPSANYTYVQSHLFTDPQVDIPGTFTANNEIETKILDLNCYSEGTYLSTLLASLFYLFRHGSV